MSIFFVYFSQKESWMDKHIIENWFHKKFMPEVHCFMKEKLFPQKAVLLLNSVPFYPRTLSSGIL
jgi:hypothetical protein